MTDERFTLTPEAEAYLAEHAAPKSEFARPSFAVAVLAAVAVALAMVAELLP